MRLYFFDNGEKSMAFGSERGGMGDILSFVDVEDCCITSFKLLWKIRGLWVVDYGRVAGDIS